MRYEDSGSQAGVEQADHPTLRTAEPTLAVPVQGNGVSHRAGTGQRAPIGQRAFADSPPGFPNPFVWLRSGILRDWRGPLGALISTWFYVPIGLALAVYGAITLGVLGLVGGGLGLHDAIPEPLRDAPLVGSAIDSFVFRSGGALAMLAGIGLGALGGLLGGMILPWFAGGTGHDALSIAGAVAGIVFAAALVGVLYTVYRVVCERWLLHLTGARRPSRREQEFLLPILHECARRLALPAVPRLLIDDRHAANAHAYTRHLVLDKGLLETFGFRREPVAAVLCHELVHWRNGDAVTSAFVRGIALPLYLIHSFATWVMRVFPHPVIRFLVWALFWPFLITVRYLVMPLQAVDTRRAELRADQGTVLGGYRAAMREVLILHRGFESGRNGWDEAVCATHPPAELRLEALETPDRRYPLDRPEPDPVEPPDTGALADPRLHAWVFVPPRGAGSRLGWAIAGGVTAVLLVVVAGLAVVQATMFTPERAVQDYFSALAHHDATAAARDTTSGTAGASLPASVLRGNGYQPPTDLRIQKVTTGSGTATVQFTYRLAGQTASGSMTVTRDSGSTWGVFHAWHLDGGWFPFGAPSGDGVAVDGVPVTSPDGGGPMSALPGAYDVTEQDSPLVSVPPVTVVVDMSGQTVGAAQFQPVLRPTAQDRINQLVDGYLDTCAKSTDPQPANCPFSYGYFFTGTTVHWQVTSYPHLTVTLRDIDHADVSTDSPGRIQATADGQTSDSALSVSGTVGVSGDQLTWQPGN